MPFSLLGQMRHNEGLTVKGSGWNKKQISLLQSLFALRGSPSISQLSIIHLLTVTLSSSAVLVLTLLKGYLELSLHGIQHALHHPSWKFMAQIRRKDRYHAMQSNIFIGQSCFHSLLFDALSAN